MPAFTFEKITPPVRRSAKPSIAIAGEQRSVMVQILDRVVGTRVKRTLRIHSETVQRERKLPE